MDIRHEHTAPVDLGRPEFWDNLPGTYRRLRRECPVSWHPATKTWLVTRFDDAAAVLRDKSLPAFGVLKPWTRLRDRHRLHYPTAIDVISRMPFNYEGNEHATLRGWFARGIARFA